MHQSLSAIVTFYNNARTVQAAIASIQAQSVPPMEIILVDDCSSPGEAAVLDELPSDIIRLRTPRNGGPGAARALGSVQARGEWIAYLDGDDCWLPNKLERQLEFHARHPELDASHCGTIVWRDGVDGPRYIDKPSRLTRELVCQGHNILASALVIRRERLLQIGNWSNEASILEDLDLAIRMMQGGLAVGFLPEALIRFRRDNHGHVTSDRWRDLEIHLNCVTRHREYIQGVVGERGLRAIRSRYLYRFGRRHGGLSGWLIALSARLMAR